MSNDMNNEHKALEKDLQKKLRKAYNDASEETTNSELDASIMAMAQQEVDARDSSSQRKSWWDWLKVPVSVTAALVVTVGIARFMVELGYYNPNSISDTENLAQTSAPKKSMVVLSDSEYESQAASPASEEVSSKVVVEERIAARQKAEHQAREMESLAVTGSRIKRVDVERAREQDTKKRQSMADQRSEALLADRLLEKSTPAEKILAESTLVESTLVESPEQKQQMSASEGELVTAKQAETDGESQTREEKHEDSLFADNAVEGTGDTAGDGVESIVVTGSRLKKQDDEELNSEGSGDERLKSIDNANAPNPEFRIVVETPYLPARDWLLKIKNFIKEGDNAAAKEHWSKFKQVYPHYSVERALFKRLESL
ncbi:hypothetical protein DZA50_01455 [Kangiella sp. HD9-110m-PIT-SAG07]|nr:hypothetical protein DZA50_01455 [Kangiella sp. HD9-110m-PIT-SAG07]